MTDETKKPEALERRVPNKKPHRSTGDTLMAREDEPSQPLVSESNAPVAASATPTKPKEKEAQVSNNNGSAKETAALSPEPDEGSRDVTKPSSQTIAIVSGKGGSGKTMVAATIAKALDDAGVSTTIIDTDIGTGGMSYYLAVKHIDGGINVGLAEMLMNDSDMSEKEYFRVLVQRGMIQKIRGFTNSYFVGVGDHRRLLREHQESSFGPRISEVLGFIKSENNNVFVCDCRGGVDEDSLAVCEFADYIVLIVETDAASFQTTIHLVDVLSDRGLSHKIRGFMINKVFDNPTTIVNNGQGAFRAQYLSAIPFDLAAIRGFLIGEIPHPSSIFGNHVKSGVRKIYIESFRNTKDRVWNFEDYAAVVLSDVDARTGGVALSALLILVFCYIPISYYVSIHSFGLTGNFSWPGPNDYFVVLGGLLAGFLGCVSVTRRLVGRIANAYIKLLGRIIGKSF